MEHDAPEPLCAGGHDQHIALLYQGVRLRDLVQQVHAVDQAERADLCGEPPPLVTRAGDHPVQIRPEGARRLCRADQGRLVLCRLQRRDVDRDRGAPGKAETRAEVERDRSRRAHLVGIDPRRHDGDRGLWHARADERGLHGRRDRHDVVRAEQRARAAHREDHASGRDDAGRRVGVPEPAAGPRRDPERVAVVRVDDGWLERLGVEQQPPPCPGVEPHGPGDLVHRNPGGRDAPRQLAAPPRHQALLHVGLRRQLARQQPDLILPSPVHASRIDVQDAQHTQTGWLAAWPRAARSSASVNGLWR